MDTLYTLIKRHSVRTYTGESLSASDLEKFRSCKMRTCGHGTLRSDTLNGRE